MTPQPGPTPAEIAGLTCEHCGRQIRRRFISYGTASGRGAILHEECLRPWNNMRNRWANIRVDAVRAEIEREGGADE